MIDHAKHIINLLQAEQENRSMEDLEKRAAPFMWIVLVVIVSGAMLLTSGVVRIYQDHKIMSNMIADCANGKSVLLGSDAVMHCSVVQLIGK